MNKAIESEKYHVEMKSKRDLLFSLNSLLGKRFVKNPKLVTAIVLIMSVGVGMSGIDPYQSATNVQAATLSIFRLSSFLIFIDVLLMSIRFGYGRSMVPIWKLRLFPVRTKDVYLFYSRTFMLDLRMLAYVLVFGFVIAALLKVVTFTDAIVYFVAAIIFVVGVEAWHMAAYLVFLKQPRRKTKMELITLPPTLLYVIGMFKTNLIGFAPLIGLPGNAFLYLLNGSTGMLLLNLTVSFLLTIAGILWGARILKKERVC